MLKPDEQSRTIVHTAGAIRGSGQGDLTWPVTEEVAKQVFAVWKVLQLHDAPLPASPRGGYGGCFLRFDQDVELFAYGGVVTLMTRSRSESRRDDHRDIERLLLASSPDSSLQTDLLH